MKQIPLHLVIEMFEDNKSTYEIANAFNTYPNKIRRMLKRAGKATRNHSEAQAIAITSGRTKHPTKGTKRSVETKRAIGEKVYRYWQNISPEKREEWIENCKKKWNDMPDEDKKRMYLSAGEGIRKAAKEGSNLEKFLLSYLTEQGYSVIFHKKNLIPNDKLEVDIFLPNMKTIIEIDGPTHFLPIWGEDKLKAVISADSHKSGLLLAEGYVIIRVKYMVKKLSNKRKIDLGNEIVDILKDINNNFPEQKDRFIEIEVS